MSATVVPFWKMPCATNFFISCLESTSSLWLITMTMYLRCVTWWKRSAFFTARLKRKPKIMSFISRIMLFTIGF